MTLNPFVIAGTHVTTLAEKQQATRVEIENVIKQAAPQLLGSYQRLMQLVYHNRWGLTPAETMGELSDAEKLELRVLAILLKTLINTVRAGVINDPLPEATITMPANLFPEI